MTTAMAAPRALAPTSTFSTAIEAVKTLGDTLPAYFRMVNNSMGEEARRDFNVTKSSMVSAVQFLLKPTNLKEAVSALHGRQFDAVMEIGKVVEQAEHRGWTNYHHSEFKRAVTYLNDAFARA